MKKWKINFSDAVIFHLAISILKKDSAGKIRFTSYTAVGLNNPCMKKEMEPKVKDLLNFL